MLKLKKNALNFLKAIVKPDSLESYIKGIEADAALHGRAYHWRVFESESVHGVRIDFDLPKDCFEEVEDLKPNVWYPREKFDGNPNNYWVIEYFSDDSCEVFTGINGNELCSVTTHFMYIESLDMLKQSTDN